jgi:hypothetical protein
MRVLDRYGAVPAGGVAKSWDLLTEYDSGGCSPNVPLRMYTKCDTN